VTGRGRGARAHGLPLLLAVLRNARALFGDNVAPPPATDLITPEDEQLVRAGCAIAAAAAAALRRLRSLEHVLRAFEALAAADAVAEISAAEMEDSNAEALGVRGLLPLVLLEHTFVPDQDASWLGTVLVALFDAAQRVGVATGDATAAPFRAAFARVFRRILTHLRALVGLLARAREAAAPAAVESVKALAAGPVLHAMLQLCTQEEEASLVVPLQAIVACDGGA
jgi:hypothetical protein